MTLQQLPDILKGFYALQGEAQSITRDDLAKFLVEKGIVIVNEEKENNMKTGIELITEERQEQITKHHYTAERDDQYINGELTIAAEASIEGDDADFPADWNLVLIQRICDKDVIDRMIIAGALYTAEKERIERRIKDIAAHIDILQNQTP